MRIAIILIIISLISISCTNNNLSEEQKITYTKMGNEIANKSFKMLSKNLNEHIKSGGVKQAIGFCKINAIPLTNELSQQNNVKIKRVSHKNRNVDNKPNKKEELVIKEYLKLISESKQLNPKIIKDGNQINYYAPIRLKQACLQCHGTPNKEIEKENYNLIKALYPNDKAIGFNEGDLRGIWSIHFKIEE